MSGKMVPVRDAVALIRPGDTVAVSGFVGSGVPDVLLEAVARSFQTHGRPRDLTFVFAAGQGDGISRGLNRIAIAGLVKRAIGGYWGLAPRLGALAVEGTIEAWNLPQGCISHLYRDIAAHKPGTVTKVGLGTFVDPRLGGGKINARSTADLVEVVHLGGGEWLLYKAFPIHVALLRATTADPTGSLSMEREALTLDALAMAEAAHNSGGLVIAQVERAAELGSLRAREVKVPGALVDCVVIAPPEQQPQTYAAQYDPSLSGELRAPHGSSPPLPLAERKIIGRRVALELRPGQLVNLGIGMPEAVAAIAAEEGLLQWVTLSTEPGAIGGEPARGLSFGASRNPEAIVDQNQMFDLYDGSGVDLACLGMAECDAQGNVNVSRFGPRLAGSGGFVNIASSARELIFAGTFTAGELEVSVEGGKLAIVQEGSQRKFVRAVQQITFSGAQAARGGRSVLYVTERCVLQLGPRGPVVVEIAPGIDLERDVLAHMGFRPQVADRLRPMDPRLFAPGLMNAAHPQRPLDERIAAIQGTVWMDLSDLSLRTAREIDRLEELMQRACATAGAHSRALLTEEGLTIARELHERFAAVAARLASHCTVSRYGRRAFALSRRPP